MNIIMNVGGNPGVSGMFTSIVDVDYKLASKELAGWDHLRLSTEFTVVLLREGGGGIRTGSVGKGCFHAGRVIGCKNVWAGV